VIEDAQAGITPSKKAGMCVGGIGDPRFLRKRIL